MHRPRLEPHGMAPAVSEKPAADASHKIQRCPEQLRQGYDGTAIVQQLSATQQEKLKTDLVAGYGLPTLSSN